MPILIACAALYLFYIYLVQGRKEKKIKNEKTQLLQTMLIGQYAKFNEQKKFR